MESDSYQTSDEIKNDESFGIPPIDSANRDHRSQKDATSNSKQTNSAIQDESAREVLKNIPDLNDENCNKKNKPIQENSNKHIQNDDLKTSNSICIDSFNSNSNNFENYQNQINNIKLFIANETTRLYQDEVNLKMSINEKLTNKIALLSVSPSCSIRLKLFQMGFLPQ